jgi:hypothetical protein
MNVVYMFFLPHPASSFLQTPESFESSIDDQAFLWSYHSDPPPSLSPVSKLSLSHSACVLRVELTDRRGGQGVGVEPIIMRPRDSLVLNKSFNTLCLSPDTAIKHPLLVLQYPSISFSHEISPRPEIEPIVHCQGSQYSIYS